MKSMGRLLSIGAIAMAVVNASAQTNVYSLNVVGYANIGFGQGDNWIGNPLDNTPNTLSNLFIGGAPVGTTISLWNSTLDLFTLASTFDGTSWSSDLTLAPGMGVLLNTPSPFTNTFVGNVLDFNGSLYDGITLHQPPPFAGSPGTYLFSSKAPATLSGHVFNTTLGQFSVFESIIGRAPQNGEQVTTLDPLTQNTHTSTFMNGSWVNGDPVLPLGEAAMFTLLPVPEPSVLGLCGIGLTAFVMLRRRRAP
jgi:hypothetical protein